VFTGLIKELGEIKSLAPKADGMSIRIFAPNLSKMLKDGGSVNINGACQTAFDISSDSFNVYATSETIKKTSFQNLRLNETTNLELPLTLNDPLGGHLVLGHVDCTGRIVAFRRGQASAILQIAFNPKFANLIVEKGSIAVDGISLTCFDIDESSFAVSVIPETIKATNLQFRKGGEIVNLEFDIFAKYIQKSLIRQPGRLTMEYMNQNGFEVAYD
jgi:riboflavin synthase